MSTHRLLLSLLVFSSLPAQANSLTELPTQLSPAAITSESCGSQLSSLLHGALAQNPKAIPRSELEAALSGLWNARLALRARLEEFRRAERLSDECVRTARLFTNAARSLEDYLGERLVRPAPFDKKNPPLALSGGFPHTMLDPSLGSLELRSGDVFASRGTAYSSAAIARVSDQPGQFSHLSILYIEPQTGKRFMLESLIEKGVVITPLEKFLTEGKGRVALFRHSDARLAAQAAERMYQVIRQADASGHHIPYDFQVNLTDHSALFCSELVSWAFDLVSRGEQLPLFPAKLSRKNRDFLQDTGLNAYSLFLPSDMDVEPRYQLVAEWRDFSQVSLLRRHDALLDKEYEWMERLDYTYSREATMLVLRKFLRFLRVSPFGGLVADFLPTDMPKRTLGAVVNLFLASIPLNRELERADKAEIKRSSAPLTSEQLKGILERLRAQDLEAYKQLRHWREFERFNGDGQPAAPTVLFHEYFRPRSEL